MKDLLRLVADRTKRVLRVSVYFAVVTGLLGVFAAGRVYGSVTKGALEIGSGLAQLGNVAGPEYRVTINGEVLNVSSAMTDMSLDEVLTRFERECREHAGGLEEELGSLPGTLQGNLPAAAKGPSGLGIVSTRDGDRRGMVACLARDVDLGYSGTAQALASFARSGDLADLGKLRYVVAERAAHGTHVIGAWTDGSFRIGRLFPARGDCPGSDLEATFRPDGSRRLLTAGVEGAPFGVRIYEVEGTPGDALARYDAAMPPLGWAPVPAVDHNLHDGRAYMKGAVDVLVSAQPSRDGKATLLSLVSMPPRDSTPGILGSR